MNVGQLVLQTVSESVSNHSDASQGSREAVEDAHAGINIAGGWAILEAQTGPRSNAIEELEAQAEGFLQSSGVDAVFPASRSNVPSVGDLAKMHKSLSNSSFAVGETFKAIDSPSETTALVDNVTNAAAAICTVEDIKDRAEALVLTRLRAIVYVYAAKLPIVGSYLIDTEHVVESGVEAPATETTPLLGALRDPRAFATQQAEGLLLRLLSPVLSRLPDIDKLDNAESNNYVKAFIECYVLVRDGCGWLFTHLQEHSLVIAPTISLGHLSTTDLAASTIGTSVASVTGYSIIQGFISSLDKVLASAPNRRIAKIACAQSAVVTGLVLFPITNIWTVQSASILQRLGQPPEVAAPASEFLRITAAGLPGYAIGEIAKRYLTSQGLSSVHTRILSVTAPLNMILNYLLVDGPIPALRLGFAGAPLCTVLSHNALAIMLIIYIVLRAIREEVEYLRGQNVIPDEPVSVNSNPDHTTGRSSVQELSQEYSRVTFFTGLGALVFAGVSGVSKSASQLWSKDFGGGKLGPHALATQAILLTTATTLYQAPKAMGNVSSDRIKKWMIKGDVQRAKIAASVAFVGTSGAVIAISNILLAFATSWGKLFNDDPIILQNVSALLPIIAFFQAVHGIGAWADGVLGALGKTAVFPSVNASADYFLGIPLGVYLALPRGWGLAGLWVGLTVSLAYSCLVATIVLVRSNWKKAVGKKEETPRGGAQPVMEANVSGTSA